MQEGANQPRTFLHELIKCLCPPFFALARLPAVHPLVECPRARTSSHGVLLSGIKAFDGCVGAASAVNSGPVRNLGSGCVCPAPSQFYDLVIEDDHCFYAMFLFSSFFPPSRLLSVHSPVGGFSAGSHTLLLLRIGRINRGIVSGCAVPSRAAGDLGRVRRIGELTVEDHHDFPVSGQRGFHNHSLPPLLEDDGHFVSATCHVDSILFEWNHLFQCVQKRKRAGCCPGKRKMCVGHWFRQGRRIWREAAALGDRPACRILAGFTSSVCHRLGRSFSAGDIAGDCGIE